MAFSAILRKSASSLVPTASQLARYSAAFSASSHLNRKPTLDSFVPVFDFSSATETKKCSSKYESLLQSIDSEIKLLDDHDSVEEPPSEFILKIEHTHIYTRRDDHTIKYHIVLTREYQGELVEISSHINDHLIGKDCEFGPTMNKLHLDVTINNHGGSSLKFDCRGTSNVISIEEMDIINSENSNDSTEFSTDEQFHIDDLDENFVDLTEFSRDEQNKVIFNDIDENLKKAFLEYIEIRGIKPSIVDFLIKRISNKKAKRKLMGLKKIKNFIEHLS